MKPTGENVKLEKRKFPRQDYLLPFNYKTRGDEFNGFMKNVSQGGAFIETSTPLEIEQDIYLDIILPVRGFSHLTGEVIRSDPNGYGIEFQAGT
jgi:Tfp pilus assembly protein PilZ